MNVELPALVLESRLQYTSCPYLSSADSQTRKIPGIAQRIRYPHRRGLLGAARRRDYCNSSPSLSARDAGRGGGSRGGTVAELTVSPRENNIVVVAEALGEHYGQNSLREIHERRTRGRPRRYNRR
jgi:hypothetical protein